MVWPINLNDQHQRRSVPYIEPYKIFTDITWIAQFQCCAIIESRVCNFFDCFLFFFLIFFVYFYIFYLFANFVSEGQYQRQHEQHCGNNNKFHGATLTGKIPGNLGHWYCGIYVHRKWCTYSHFRTVESYKTQSKGRGRNTYECCWCYRYRWMIYVGVRSLLFCCSLSILVSVKVGLVRVRFRVLWEC